MTATTPYYAKAPDSKLQWLVGLLVLVLFWPGWRLSYVLSLGLLGAVSLYVLKWVKSQIGLRKTLLLCSILLVGALAFVGREYVAYRAFEAYTTESGLTGKFAFVRHSQLPSSAVKCVVLTDEVDQEAIRSLVNAPWAGQIEDVRSFEAKITDEDLHILQALPNLKTLLLRSERVTVDAIYEFHSVRPMCSIWFSNGETEIDL